MNELFGNACIIDGEHALSPDSIEKIEARLDRSFCTEGGASQCIMFRSGNDVGSSVLLAYLIKRKINFFVQGNYNQVSSQSDIPSFCDRVLTLARGYEPDSLENAIVLEVNRDCVRCDLLNPLSGYVIFASSGTTGSRKYICFSSTKLLLNASKIVDRFGLSGLSKVLIPVPISHSYGFKVGLLPSMIAGATLRVIDRNNIVKLIGAINDFQPDIVLLTPTLCKMMQVMDVKNKKKALFISAGDKLNEQLYRSFELKFGTLLNLYGCTELGAMAISSEDERDDDRMTGAIKPLKGVNIQLDHSGIAREIGENTWIMAIYWFQEE
jgi:acyl-coenzyme A synthetase/AMP-(fatty) acid ligase